MNSVHYSSITDKHNTPAWLVGTITDFLGGINLDPCTDESNPCKAERFYTEATDGLAHEWKARTVYMNPPYGREIGLWTFNLADHYRRGLIGESIALLPARTDTQWWAGLTDYAVCFLRGRLKFNDCGQSAPFPSALIYMGRSWWLFHKHFSRFGQVYRPVGEAS